MAGMPKKVCLGRDVYDVFLVDEVDDDDSSGDFNRRHNRIRIKKGLPNHFERTVVLHELLHAIMHRSGLSDLFKEEKEEQIVLIIGEWLTDALRDNPELVAYLTRK